MPYQQTKGAIFIGATRCFERGEMVEVPRTELMSQTDIERAFEKWKKDGGWGVAMMVKDSMEHLGVIVFTPAQSTAVPARQGSGYAPPDLPDAPPDRRASLRERLVFQR